MQDPSTQRAASGSSPSAFGVAANYVAPTPTPDPSISNVEVEGQELSGTEQPSLLARIGKRTTSGRASTAIH
jgi:hypothetical protein